MKPALLLLLAAFVAQPATRPTRYAIVLNEAPAAKQLIAAGTTSKTPSRAAVAIAGQKALAAQQALRSALEEKSFRVVGANSFLANVMFVEASEEKAQELRSLPGVRWVERLLPLRPRLNRALDLLKVPAAWGSVNGEQNAGAGIKIGILDTGIDQTHPGFKEGALQYPAGFPKGDSAFVNKKVIVARSYVNELVGTHPNFSRPDDLSPRDRVGHGTAVAMIAAGSRTTGPAGTISGVAPAAWLGNYKVFGSPGVNDEYTFDGALLTAMEDAQRDGMNMVVLSMGAPAVWGPNDRGATCDNQGTDPCDFRADAIEYAAQLGMLAIVAAGNSGNEATTYPATGSIESPGTAPSALTVGATTNAHILYQSVRVQGSNVPSSVQTLNTLFGEGPKPNPSLTANVRDAAVVGGSQNARACAPLANNSLSGAIALVERGDCEPTLKIQYAERAGAVAVLIYQQNGFDTPFPLVNLGVTGIPAATLGNRSGLDLKNYIASNQNAQVTLDTALREISTNEFDTVSIISSRGPSIRENAIKPEVMAVGTDLYTAAQTFDPNGDMFDATGFTVANGTSFAAAMAAGVAAMVWQRNSQLEPREVKSAIVNTADNRIQEDYGRGFEQASVLDQGNGIINAQDAVRTTVTVFPSTLSFGVLPASTLPSIGLTLCNRGSSDVTLNFQVRPIGSQQSSLTLSPSSLGVRANSCVNQGVTASLSSTTPAPGIYEGAVAITGGSVPLRVPYLYLVGDGVPYSILPLGGNGFVANIGSTQMLTLKVLDRYGVPVANVPTKFQSTAGGGSIDRAGQTTDNLGIGYAFAKLGSQNSDQRYYASVGSARDFGIYFNGRARLVPTIQANGIVNAASSQLGRGIAPGSYITIYGSGLSESVKTFNTPYLPLSIGGVSVSFDVPSTGRSFPGTLSYVSDGQVNVQVPWELQGVSSVLIKVSIGDSSSSTVSVPVLDAAPAAFEYDESGGRRLVAALDGNFGLIGSGNAARRGEIIQVYANGLGPVNNQPASGAVAPSQPLATSKAVPSVTIGGRPAEVVFSGLAPQFVGLYQVNVRVPQDAPTGLQPLVISTGGVDSKAAMLPVQ